MGIWQISMNPVEVPASRKRLANVKIVEIYNGYLSVNESPSNDKASSASELVLARASPIRWILCRLDPKETPRDSNVFRNGGRENRFTMQETMHNLNVYFVLQSNLSNSNLCYSKLHGTFRFDRKIFTSWNQIYFTRINCHMFGYNVLYCKFRIAWPLQVEILVPLSLQLKVHRYVSYDVKKAIIRYCLLSLNF